MHSVICDPLISFVINIHSSSFIFFRADGWWFSYMRKLHATTQSNLRCVCVWRIFSLKSLYLIDITIVSESGVLRQSHTFHTCLIRFVSNFEVHLLWFPEEHSGFRSVMLAKCISCFYEFSVSTFSIDEIHARAVRCGDSNEHSPIPIIHLLEIFCRLHI